MLPQLYVVDDQLIQTLFDSAKDALILRATLPQKFQQTLIVVEDFRRDERYINNQN